MATLETITNSDNHNSSIQKRRISIPPVYKEVWSDSDSKNNNQDTRRTSLNVPENTPGKNLQFTSFESFLTWPSLAQPNSSNW